MTHPSNNLHTMVIQSEIFLPNFKNIEKFQFVCPFPYLKLITWGVFADWKHDLLKDCAASVPFSHSKILIAGKVDTILCQLSTNTGIVVYILSLLHGASTVRFSEQKWKPALPEIRCKKNWFWNDEITSDWIAEFFKNVLIKLWQKNCIDKWSSQWRLWKQSTHQPWEMDRENNRRLFFKFLAHLGLI